MFLTKKSDYQGTLPQDLQLQYNDPALGGAVGAGRPWTLQDAPGSSWTSPNGGSQTKASGGVASLVHIHRRRGSWTKASCGVASLVNVHRSRGVLDEGVRQFCQPCTCSQVTGVLDKGNRRCCQPCTHSQETGDLRLRRQAVLPALYMFTGVGGSWTKVSGSVASLVHIEATWQWVACRA